MGWFHPPDDQGTLSIPHGLGVVPAGAKPPAVQTREDHPPALLALNPAPLILSNGRHAVSVPLRSLNGSYGDVGADSAIPFTRRY